MSPAYQPTIQSTRPPISPLHGQTIATTLESISSNFDFVFFSNALSKPNARNLFGQISHLLLVPIRFVCPGNFIHFPLESLLLCELLNGTVHCMGGQLVWSNQATAVPVLLFKYSANCKSNIHVEWHDWMAICPAQAIWEIQHMFNCNSK